MIDRLGCQNLWQVDLFVDSSINLGKTSERIDWSSRGNARGLIDWSIAYGPGWYSHAPLPVSWVVGKAGTRIKKNKKINKKCYDKNANT